MMRARVPLLLVLLSILAAPVLADWLKDYEDGMKAAQAGDWRTVVQKMTSALADQPKENPRARPYGNVFVAYHPYYYRGIAQFELGNHKEAIADLQRATGAGKVNLGAAGGFLARAEAQLAQQQAPPQQQPPAVAQQPPPTQTTPAQPAVDPALEPARNRGRDAIQRANAKLGEAQRARAASRPEFSQAQTALQQASAAAIGAETTSDWRNVETLAERAITAFELAISQTQIAAQQQPTPAQRPTVTATEDALASKRNEIRRAVEAYFAGQFRDSAREFDRLARQERDNALLWAFLGASHYYTWYLDGRTDETERQAAIAAFRTARQHNSRLQLNENYFPERVRTFYASEVAR